MDIGAISKTDYDFDEHFDTGFEGIGKTFFKSDGHGHKKVSIAEKENGPVLKTIGIKTSVEGFHAFAKAVEMFGEEIDFLALRHRHNFGIEMELVVEHNDRDREFILVQREVKEYIANKYGTPAEFGNMSCEAIAEELMFMFDAVMVKVDEDGENYAKIVKRGTYDV